MALYLGITAGGMKADADLLILTLLTSGLLFSGWKLGCAINAWLEEDKDEKKSGPDDHPPGDSLT